MNRDEIKSLALACGFKEKLQQAGHMGLNAYVYDFAIRLLAEQAKGQAAPVLAVKTWKERAQEHIGPLWSGYKPDQYMKAEIVDLRAALATCAEEARREGYEQGRFDEQMAQGPSREEWARIDAEKDAPRTAGGDAVAADGPEFTLEDPDLNALLNAVADWAAGTPQNMDTGMHLMSLIEAVASRLQTVAEAAAQADDEPVADKWAMLRVARKHATVSGENLGVADRYTFNADTLFRFFTEASAAPTAQPTHSKTVEFDGIAAQPTPNEKGQPEGQPVSNDTFPHRCEESSVAQPTPPDDELTDGRINDLTMDHLGKWPSFEAQSWACKVAHVVVAALRQPGALPDDERAMGG